LGEPKTEGTVGLLTDDVLPRAEGAIRVADDDTDSEGALDVLIEDGVTRNVVEARRGRIGQRDVEPVGDHLGELTTGDGLIRAEATVRVARGHRERISGAHLVDVLPGGVGDVGPGVARDIGGKSQAGDGHKEDDG
jgi:hypothetical protein